MPFASYETPFTSYAQAREDVVLIRSLRDVPVQDGFYIDVGVYAPEDDSVTKAFYDAGWRGINVEPSPALFKAIAEARPRDINLEVAASSAPGELSFFNVDGHQLGTVDRRYASDQTNVRQVKAMTLAQICEQHAPPTIHFLKIDVEGHERNVLEGMDFTRFRPWILLIESVAPNSHVPTYGEWESIVLAAGYRFVLADAINRYYISEERADIAPNFSLLADNFTHWREVRALELERAKSARLVAEVESLKQAAIDRASIEARTPFRRLFQRFAG